MSVNKQLVRMPFCAAWLFIAMGLVLSTSALAEICSLPYTDVLQTHKTSGSGSSDLKFDCGAKVLNATDKTFQTRGIKLSGGSSSSSSGSGGGCNTLTCETQHCVASGTAASKLDAGSFQQSSSNSNLTVNGGQTKTLGSGNKTQYKTVRVKSNGTLNATSFGGSTKYKIKTLRLDANSTVNLVAGEYWINKLNIKGNNAVINVSGSGTVKLFINGKADIKYKILFNANNSITNPAQQFWIYAYNDFKLRKDNAEIVGFIYSKKKITLDKKSIVRGAMAGETMEIKKNAKVYFDSGALQNSCATSISHFVISHDGAGTYCIEENVQVTAMDNSSVATNYSETITLSNDAGKGTWRLITGNGSLVDLTANDGVATYTYSTADQGVATFGLTYPEGKSNLALSVQQTNQSSIQDDNSHGNLVFSPSGFLITETQASTTPYVTTQVAGQGDTVYLKAFGYDPTDETCGVIEEYTGSQSLKFWSEYVEPTSGTKSVTINNTPIGNGESNATTIPVSFSSGIASVDIKYRDVGRIRVHVKQSTLQGASGIFVVKPAKLVVSATGNPGTSTADGTVYKKAGEAFTIQIQVQDLDGNLTPNFGSENTPETLKVKSSQVVLPAGGRNGSDDQGTILNGTGFNKVSAGTFECTSCAFDEVGIIKLQGHLSDDNYLGTGDVPNKAESGNVGRFTPDHFAVAENIAPQFTTGCASGGFSYLDQPFVYGTEGNVVVTAQAVNDTTTQNYTGDFWKLSVSGLNTTYSAAGSATLDASNAEQDSAITETDNGDGTGSYTFSDGGGIRFAHTNGVNLVPFDAEIAYAITVTDSDNISFANNPFTVGEATAGNGIAYSAGKNIRHGRVYLDTKVGSELEDLSLPFEVQYYASAAAGFVKHTQDSCTVINNASHVVLTPQSGLNTTATVSGFTAGAGQLILSKPTPSGATGYVDVEVNLSALGANLPWLQFDWPHDGNNDGLFDDNPKVRATFGQYGGSEGVIYQREAY